MMSESLYTRSLLFFPLPLSSLDLWSWDGTPSSRSFRITVRGPTASESNEMVTTRVSGATVASSTPVMPAAQFGSTH